VSERSYDGDCFSTPIAHNINITDPFDILIVEFKFMPVRHPFN